MIETITENAFSLSSMFFNYNRYASISKKSSSNVDAKLLKNRNTVILRMTLLNPKDAINIEFVTPHGEEPIVEARILGISKIRLVNKVISREQEAQWQYSTTKFR